MVMERLIDLEMMANKELWINDERSFITSRTGFCFFPSLCIVWRGLLATFKSQSTIS